MNEVVVDSSAVLALLKRETGAEHVAAALVCACISTVNLAEIVTKLREDRWPASAAAALVKELRLRIVPFSRAQAIATGHLRMETRHLGLSLGDRACLALGMQLSASILTADAAWTRLDLGPRLRVFNIRNPT